MKDGNDPAGKYNVGTDPEEFLGSLTGPSA